MMAYSETIEVCEVTVGKCKLNEYMKIHVPEVKFIL